MSSITSQASLYNQQNDSILPKPSTTDTEGNTYKYTSNSVGGKSKKRKYKRKGGKTRGRRSNRKTIKRH